MNDPTSANENTPLIQGEQRSHETTGLKPRFPWGQLSILLVLQLAEPMTYQVIAPFAPQLVRDVGVTHGDERKVGYYVGMMQSLFFVTQALAVLHWSRLSDHIGRKPVILLGVFGISLSMYSLGLSRTFAQAIVARCLNGALNGNIGVLKSHFASLFEPSNIAEAYAYLPIAWSTGATLGPLIGGALVHPVEHYPGLFGNSPFLKRYPYFLPCAVSGTFALFAWFLAFTCLKETIPSPMSLAQLLKLRRAKPNLIMQNVVQGADLSVTEDVTTSVRSENAASQEDNKPLPLRALLTRDVIVAGGNYALLSILDIMFRGIHPLFLSTPRELGGLALSPSKIGMILSIFGVASGLFEVLCFAWIVKVLGTKYTYILGVGSSVLVFVCFPLITFAANDRGEVGITVWLIVAGQLAISALTSLSYGCIFIFITAASPNQASLGSTNGLCQVAVSWFRALGPALSNSLYSISLRERSWTVYWVLEAVSVFSIATACLLPAQPWRK